MYRCSTCADRHLDITFVLQVVPLFPYFINKCLAIPTFPFFHILVNGFCVTIFCTFFDDPFLSLYCWVVSVGEENLNWCQLAHHQLMNKPETSF